MLLKHFLIFIATFFSISSYGQDPSFNLNSVFNHQPEAIASFIDHVLRQLPSKKVIEIIDNIKINEHDLDDAKLYENICTKIASLRSRLDIIKIIKLISFQKQLLEKQLRALLTDVHVIGNCLEIGTPGTYASTIRDCIKGDVYALLAKSNVTDIIQAQSFKISNSFKGYDKYVALNDYEPISIEIADNQIDLIICTIGLHHVPPCKLDNFIASIKRVLRPGGFFLLREHNAHSPELISLAYAAHSIFNAVIPQENLDTELKEVRNFNALVYWKNLLEKHGFDLGTEEYLQEGDSTLNTFIKCIKKSVTKQDQELSASFKAQQYTDYSRDSAQTYLTTPEWNNVDAAQHYGDYINKIPFYEFPYMAHVNTFWKTFLESWRCAAKEKGGNINMLLSPNILFNYTFMNVFIGTFMTIEYTTKAVISWPIRAMMSGVEATTLLALIHDPKNEISDIDSSITTKEIYEGDLKLVSISRYMQFLKSVKKILGSSVTFIKIANNQNILCKIRYKNDMQLRASWVQKFTWKMPTIDYIYAAYLIPVKELKDFVFTLEQLGGELLYIHDF
jgi:SAM-dependent methyltransferase